MRFITGSTRHSALGKLLRGLPLSMVEASRSCDDDGEGVATRRWAWAQRDLDVHIRRRTNAQAWLQPKDSSLFFLLPIHNPSTAVTTITTTITTATSSNQPQTCQATTTSAAAAAAARDAAEDATLVMYQRPQRPTIEERVEQKRKDFQKAQAELLQAEELHWARAHSLELLAAMPEGPGKEAFKRMLRAFQTFPKNKPELVAAEGPAVTDETPAAATTDNTE
ncbi:hypothetical protein CH63R_08658 [Colletotrichum higginsianum IMI 349063]|uniref:Uncharacterized protein n=1 Tax=Colletotrichum higginsianum (strain IMI 349063) TaxID=759273 RepID=A0A1B7Y551_COLHI|nr:hypothetical protein CH63R_08658 [Colletotrichum higginsianum IMI 349063]OBR07137.1 hypothetical protein CH63R_08658 [Colletotrichum higginsianum IMI 349063]